MLGTRSDEQRITGCERNFFTVANKRAVARLHNVNFVLLVRCLHVFADRLVVTKLHTAALEQDRIEPVCRIADALQCVLYSHALCHVLTVSRIRLKYSSLQSAKSRVKTFTRNFRGVAFFGGLTVNTIFWFIPLFFLAVLKLLLPVPALRRLITLALMWCGENWISFNTLLMRYGAKVDIESHGLENLKSDGWYLVIANHQTWVDILVLQAVFNRRVPFLKFFIKQQLIWFPVLGVAWWALDMPFMKRYSPSYLAKNPHMKGRDLQTTRRACEKFRDTPTSILNFIEGTRFSEKKRDNRKSPYQNLLQPRAGGFAVAVSSMGELFTSIVDVTLVYPDVATRFWDMCCGAEVRVIIDIRERKLEQWLVQGDYEGDREFRKKMHAWLGEIWAEKDAIIAKTRKEYGR